MITTRQITSQSTWDDIVLERAGHPLQLWGWGEVKAAHNWRVVRIVVERDGAIIGAAQLLIRHLPTPFRALGYIPRGPLCLENDTTEVLEVLSSYVKQAYGAVALTIEPDWDTWQPVSGWQPSSNTILIPRTVILDLRNSEEALLGAMAKKTRQYIRKSTSEALEVRRVRSREEVAACLEIYKQTATRAGFALHGDQYYYDIFDKMGDHAPLMAAFLDSRPVAFLWLAISATTAFELYGGMNDDGQRLRANYALKWQTIQLMKKWGIERYDMNGLLNDGVSTFKQSFASHEDMLVGTYDKPLSPLYILWDKALPFGKNLIRKIKNR